MRVVKHRKAEVAGRRGARVLHDVLAASHQLDDDKRKIGEPQWIGLVASGKKLRKRQRIWRLRQ